MIKQNKDFIFYVVDQDSDTIYNKISDTTQSISLYPDIAFTHPFQEKELINHQVYNDARSLLRQHGSAHCIFLSVTDIGALDDFSDAVISSCQNVYGHAEPDGGMIESVQKLCDLLSLSATMRNSFIQLFTYYSTIGDVSKLIEHIYSSYTLPVSTKNEGKKIYDDIYRYIIS